MTWNPWRITKWQFKLLYVVAAFVVLGLVFRLVGLALPLGTAYDIFATATDLAAFLLGARIFRGANELVIPPRTWWRMTSRPILSRRLGILFLVFSLLFLLSALSAVFGWVHSPRPDNFAITISGVVEFAILSYLYLNSAVRLARATVAAQ